MAKDFIGIQGVTQTAARTFDFADESGIGATTERRYKRT